MRYKDTLWIIFYTLKQANPNHMIFRFRSYKFCRFVSCDIVVGNEPFSWLFCRYLPHQNFIFNTHKLSPQKMYCKWWIFSCRSLFSRVCPTTALDFNIDHTKARDLQRLKADHITNSIRDSPCEVVVGQITGNRVTEEYTKLLFP